jgi:REP element-mobilizing transposase RayT
MPRRNETFAANQVYHLYNRGVNRANIFSSAENYCYLLRQVKDILSDIPATIFAYCLMPNHYHFVTRQDGDVPLSEFIGRLFKRYSQAYNRQEARTGPLFAGRFRNIHVDTDEYLIHLARYVHLNPVAAGLCHNPGEWPYSNYLEWIEQRNGTLVDRDWIRHYFPIPASYIQFVNSELSTEMEERLRPYLLE